MALSTFQLAIFSVLEQLFSAKSADAGPSLHLRANLAAKMKAAI